MLFHTLQETQARGFASEDDTRVTGRHYALDFRRVMLGVILLLGFVIAAFVAESRGWSQGTTTFLHLTEVLAGGLVGLIVGENSGIKEDK